MARGQVAVEYLILGAFLLLFVGTFAGYALTLYYDSVKITALNNSVVSLANAADKVYSLGEGNVVLVEINLPDDVVSSGIIGKDFYFARQLGGRVSYSYGNTIPQLEGSLPSTSGIYKIAVKALDSNVSFNVAG